VALLRQGQPQRLAPVARIEPETDVERRIVSDPEWIEGASWGTDMEGHPEDTVADHVEEVLGNVDRFGFDDATRARLRLIALTHDTFKHGVRWWLPWRNDHARLARAFAVKHVDDEGVLVVVEHHDDAYRAWRRASKDGRWDRAERRAEALIDRLGEHLDLFRAFYRCDNATGTKSPDDRHWFEGIVERRAAR
jgi:hypothetical protein